MAAAKQLKLAAVGQHGSSKVAKASSSRPAWQQ